MKLLMFGGGGGGEQLSYKYRRYGNQLRASHVSRDGTTNSVIVALPLYRHTLCRILEQILFVCDLVWTNLARRRGC